MEAAAVSGGPALARLLRGGSRAQLEVRSRTARRLLRTFLQPFTLVSMLDLAPSASAVVEKFWQRVAERPSALAATVEALQACSAGEDDCRIEELCLIGGAIGVYSVSLVPGNAGGRQLAGWHDLLGSDSVQCYAMEALSFPILSQPTQQALKESFGIMLGFLSAALAAGFARHA